MICTSWKIIFIHIPKCGGTSIESVFHKPCSNVNIHGTLNNKPWWKHDTVRNIERRFPELENYYKFSVVRNPWSHTVSMYNYMWKSSYEWPCEWRQNQSRRGTTGREILSMNFKDWVTSKWFETPTLQSVNVTTHSPNGLGSYSEYITGNNWSMDYICRLETLQQDFDIVCDTIGHPQTTLPLLNSYTADHYSEYYDNDTREIVREKYAEDIDMFDYTFN